MFTVVAVALLLGAIDDIFGIICRPMDDAAAARLTSKRCICGVDFDGINLGRQATGRCGWTDGICCGSYIGGSVG